MLRSSTGLLLIGGLATALTLVIAWPIVLHPTQLVYGHEIVGRHPDPYAVIAQIAGDASQASFPQPITDAAGRLLGRLIGPVAAFNVLVLITFPLTAMATYALARYLTASHGAAAIAALAFAFSPFRLAHAAYHPHFSQTQWIPLFLLATVATVDRVSLGRILGLLAASAALPLASYDEALVAAVIAPIVVVAFWVIRPDADRNPWPLVGPLAVLLLAAGAVVGALWIARAGIFEGWLAPPFPFADVVLYRGRWWAYFTPAVDHPVLSGMANDAFARGGINIELAELQLFAGYSLLLLTLAALVTAGWRWFREPQLRAIVATAAVGFIAALISLGPTSGSCEPASLAPACLVVRVFPPFRAYARFGLVTELAVAIAAGTGAMLLARGSRPARNAAVALVVLAAFEYWPLPARAHDVLPTSAHRWMAGDSGHSRTLDCYPPSRATATIPALAGKPIDLLSDAVRTCQNPELDSTLAALGYTHVIVRNGNAASKLTNPLPAGIELFRSFPDASLYSVTASPPAVAIVSATGFYPLERSGNDWWRWMGSSGVWTVRNTTGSSRRMALSVNLESVGVPRTMTATLDDQPPATVKIGLARVNHVLGPWTLAPGEHLIRFAADGEPLRPSDVNDSSRDRRSLAVSFRNERWVDAR